MSVLIDHLPVAADLAAIRYGDSVYHTQVADLQSLPAFLASIVVGNTSHSATTTTPLDHRLLREDNTTTNVTIRLHNLSLSADPVYVDRSYLTSPCDPP